MLYRTPPYRHVSSQAASADQRSQSSNPAVGLPPEMTFSTLPNIRTVMFTDRVYISYRAKLNCPGRNALPFVQLYRLSGLLENSLELFNCVIYPAPSSGYHGIVVKAGTIR